MNPQIQSLLQKKTAANNLKWEAPPSAVDKWSDKVVALVNDDATITIYDQIGEGFFTEGVTANRISAALRKIGNREVTVNINSPGGDFFEGLAIYNLLKEHPHKVTVNVVGLAASAASFIAMAGDEINIAKAGFLMIHNVLTVAAGNKKDFLATAEVLEQFDSVLADIYADSTGIKKEDIVSMLDAETWMSGEEAVTNGFAGNLLASDEMEQIEESSNAGNVIAIRVVDAALARQGLSRKDRRSLLNQIKGKQDATEKIEAKQDAGEIADNNLELETALLNLLETIKH